MAELEIKKTYGLFENALNKKLISVLKQRGEDVLVFPSIKAARLDLTAESVNHLKNLTGFDWIILTDTFAADYFIEALGELEIDFYELDNVTTCALGEAVADRLRFVQVHADVIPSKTNAEAVFAAISNYAGDELGDLRVLIVCEKSADRAIIEKLKSAAAVRELPIYAAGFEVEGTNLK
ncbi:MAG TPA: uroporphyrinogen-III synthase, partial [Pyrinomonadaceae bacterium]